MMSVRLHPKTNLVGPWNVVGQLYYIFIFNHVFYLFLFFQISLRLLCIVFYLFIYGSYVRDTNGPYF